MVRSSMIALSLGAVAAFTTQNPEETQRRQLLVDFTAPLQVAQNNIDQWTAGATEVLKDALVNGLDWYFGSDRVVAIDGLNGATTTTTFTTHNYFSPMLDFLIAGLRNDNGVAMEDWYLRTEPVDGNRVRDGPGPNTHTHMGYDDVTEILSQYGAKIEAGTLDRYNELGMQILGKGAWPEYQGVDYSEQTINLGQSNANHAFVRPYLGNMLDKGERTDSTCDGSTCWNEAWLQREANAFFQGRDRISESDFKPFVTKILHRIHLNQDVSDAEAQEFSDYMGKILVLIPLSDQMLNDPLTEAILGVQDTLAKKRAYMENARARVRQKFPEITDETKVNMVASALLDSLTFAGGLSVPTVLQYVIANTHMSNDNKHDALKDTTLDEENLDWILLEAIRKYAPVAGVPFWDLTEDGAKHVIPNVAQALMDPAKFDDPLTFKNRGSSFQDIELAWAAPARHNGDVSNPNSHDCPAKELSMQISKTFLNAFIDRGDWKAINADDIAVNVNTAGSWTLLKRGITHTTGCAFFPSCDDGYTVESTRWCNWWSWQREHTCRV